MILPYILRLLKAPVSASRFTIITPPLDIVKQHTLYDRKHRRLFSLSAAGSIDYGTIIQVFLNQEYRLDHLARFHEQSAWFANVNANGLKPLILDCGANIGLASSYLAKEWPSSVIWAIEPSRRNADLAEKNLPKCARLLVAAIGPEDGVCQILNPEGEPNAYRVIAEAPPDTRPSTPMVSMATLLKEADEAGLQPFILKVDIEGGEAQLFEKASQWLPRWPIMMIELHDWMLLKSGSSRSVLKAIVETERDVICHGNTLISIRNTS